MESRTSARYFQPIELDNTERLEVAALMDGLKDARLISNNTNFGQFITECYARGKNEYMKDLYRKD